MSHGARGDVRAPVHGAVNLMPFSPEQHWQHDLAPANTAWDTWDRWLRTRLWAKCRARARQPHRRQPWSDTSQHSYCQRLSDSLMAVRLCSITVLLGVALLLPAPGGTQAPSNTGRKDLATEQDLAEKTILGTQAMELLEGEITKEVEPGIKVFSSSAWARWVSHQVQEGPEEDRDHLYHPQDNAREADVLGPPWVLSLEVQSGPEEDRDHLHHS
ncbi:uncharacterized protein LOC135315575 isoform X1 [Phalacrocorax carbo]|uniref:uncharacterized protein LOC135315575 isoform X1 n=1 Tax=Phalacrocorax carbo TaxID=9209 RepID=UPI003119C41D